MTDFLISSLHACRLCAMTWVSAKDLPVHSAMLSIQLLFGMPLLRLPSTVPCNVTLVRPSILSRAHTISIFAALQLPGDLRTVLYDGFPHMLVSDSVFVGDAKYLWEASKLWRLDYPL